MIPGSAMGLRKSPCIVAPATPRAMPTKPPTIIPGQPQFLDDQPLGRGVGPGVQTQVVEQDTGDVGQRDADRPHSHRGQGHPEKGHRKDCGSHAQSRDHAGPFRGTDGDRRRHPGFNCHDATDLTVLPCRAQQKSPWSTPARGSWAGSRLRAAFALMMGCPGARLYGAELSPQVPGRSPGSRISAFRAFPLQWSSGASSVGSPITVALPRRSHTVFPIKRTCTQDELCYLTRGILPGPVKAGQRGEASYLSAPTRRGVEPYGLTLRPYPG